MNKLFPIVPLLLAAAYGIAFLFYTYRACAPKKGTTQWIHEYDRPPFSVGTAAPLSLREMRYALIPVGMAVILVGGGAVIFRSQPLATSVLELLSAVFSAALTFVLAAVISGDRQTALIASGTAALCAFQLAPQTVFLLLAALFLWLWLTGGAWWQLPVCGVSLAIAAYFLPQAALLLPMALIAAIFGAWQRVKADTYNIPEAVLALLSLLAAFAAVLPLTYLPWAIANGLGFPQCFASGVYWGAVASSVFQPNFVFVYQGEFDFWLWIHGLLKLPCVVLTFAGAVTAGYLLWRKRSGEALFIFAGCASSALLYLGSVDITEVSAVLALICFVPRLKARLPLPIAAAMTCLPAFGAVLSDIFYFILVHSIS